MEFEDYVMQLYRNTEPVRMPTGSVIVRPQDCYQIKSFDNHVIVELVFKADLSFKYTTQTPNNLPQYQENESILYTMDGDGNPQVGSVFKLV